MEDLLNTYQTMALQTKDYHARNRHKHSTTPQEDSEDSFTPPECSYALGNTFD